MGGGRVAATPTPLLAQAQSSSTVRSRVMERDVASHGVRRGGGRSRRKWGYGVVGEGAAAGWMDEQPIGHGGDLFLRGLRTGSRVRTGRTAGAVAEHSR